MSYGLACLHNINNNLLTHGLCLATETIGCLCFWQYISYIDLPGVIINHLFSNRKQIDLEAILLTAMLSDWKVCTDLSFVWYFVYLPVSAKSFTRASPLSSTSLKHFLILCKHFLEDPLQQSKSEDISDFIDFWTNHWFIDHQRLMTIIQDWERDKSSGVW